MRQKLLMAATTLAISLGVIPAAGTPAPIAGPVSSAYAKAIYSVIQRQWEPDSFNAELEPGSSCTVRIVQIPGGDVLSVDVLPECGFSKAGRDTVVEAVRRSGPLPYLGFEVAFQREIRVVFHAPSVSQRQARDALDAANAQVKKGSAEMDRQWEATVGLAKRRAEYTSQCSFHLRWEMPKVKLRRPIKVIVTVDRLGKVVRVTNVREKPIDEQLVAALKAVSPCGPVPVELIVGTGTVEIGPITLRDRGD